MKAGPTVVVPRVSSHSQGQGFALLEVLIAWALIAVGLLALASLYAHLAPSADLARQRSEAVRLAQAHMEHLRGFNQFHASAGQDTHENNASFTRRWQHSLLLQGALKTQSVAVTWNDRRDQAQSVQLLTLIAHNDPAWSGTLIHPLGADRSWRHPQDRHPHIPLEAIRLGGDRSAWALDGEFSVVLDNTTGEITMVCSGLVTQASHIVAANCQTAMGLLLTGYITRTAHSLNWPSGIHLGGLQGLAAAPASRCHLSEAVDPTTGRPLPAHRRYACVLFPQDAGSGWSGRVQLAGLTTHGDAIVCRVQPTDTQLASNERNQQPYRAVSRHLHQQNYVLHLASAGTCPETSANEGHKLLLHQDCRRTDTDQTASQCPALAVTSAA